MKKYNTLATVILVGILTSSAQARQDTHKKVVVPQKAQVKKVVKASPAKVQKKTVTKKVVQQKTVKLPKNHRRVTHRGVTYYVAAGRYYRHLQSGYVLVKAPW